jgi:hypothetical protein
MPSCARAGRFRLTLVMLAACAFGLCLAAAPALAAGPETPVIKVYNYSPTVIDLMIFTDPNASGEAGEEEVLYNLQTPSECKGGHVQVWKIYGNQYNTYGEPERFIENISGLVEGTQYTICATTRTPGGSASSTLTFSTAVKPQTPEALKAEPVGGRTATLHGVLNPLAAPPKSEPGSYHFLYRPSTKNECQGPGAMETPSTPAGGAKEEAVSASLTGLIPNTRYAFCLVASNEATNPETAVSAPGTPFTTPVAVPSVGEESVSDVAATSATFAASVAPGGLATSYVFEYAPAGGSFVPVPGAEGQGSLPEGTAGVTVGAHVQGLQAATDYEFRLSATNSVGTAVGEPQSFTTQLAGGTLALPDDRQWELVSPPDKHGAQIFPNHEGGLPQASVDGDAMTFVTSAPTESEPPGYSTDEQVFATRGPDGWSWRDISLPHEHETGPAIGKGSEYVAFSEDLSRALVQPHGLFDPSLSPEASEQTPYLRTLFLNGDVNDPCVASCFRPLVTGKPGYANVPPGTAFGEEENCHLRSQAICGPEFAGDATPDLSHILLQSQTPLVAGEQSPYEWNEGRLSVGAHLPALRVSTSEDGSWKYFMSESVLAPGGVSGQPNMYVSHGGVSRLVAVLSGTDASSDWIFFPNGEFGDLGVSGLNSRTSRVSPDGRWFAFMSDQDLTGYDTHDAVTGQPDEEVYLYRAPEDLAAEAGTLVCASCDPTGARPVGKTFKKLAEDGLPLATVDTQWPAQQGIAANVPGWTSWKIASADYQSRYLSDSGRLFFNSSDALVPQDVNGNEDVYEYEPPGVGSCTTASVVYSARSQGCVSLISSGQDPAESGFLDASESGGDVFFLTAAKLAPQDYDTALDVYDARECTEAAACYPAPAVTPPACDTGDSCKSAPTPQPATFGAPPSATFSGPGNTTPAAPTPKTVTKKTVKCKKGFVKDKQGECLKSSKKKAKKAKRASNDRRTSR